MPSLPKRAPDPFLKAFRLEASRRGMTVTHLDGDNATLRQGDAKGIVSLAEPRRAFDSVFPDDRQAVLADFLAAFADIIAAQTSEPFEDVRGRILPRISPRIASQQPVPSIPLVEGALDVYFVVVEPKRMRYITRPDLTSWGMRLRQLLPVGIANLRARTNWGLLRQLGGMPRARLYPKVDAFVAARMLLLRDALRPWPQAGAIVAVPDRSVLAFLPVAHIDTVASLDTMVLSAREAGGRRPFPLIPELLWFDGRAWEPIPILEDVAEVHAEPSDRLIEAIAVA